MYYSAEKSIIQPHKRVGYEPVDGYPKHIVFGHSTRWPKLIKNLAERTPELIVGKRTKGRFEDELNFTYKEVPMKYVLAPEGTLGLQTQIVSIQCGGGNT